jgi:hypothetical protein
VFSLDTIWETVIAVILAAAGGVARLLNMKDKKKLKWGKILSELFISGFTGLMVLLLARTIGLTGDWLGLVCGMAGWVGPRILDLVAAKSGKRIGIDINDKSGKDENK